jgi:hypothetical protein
MGLARSSFYDRPERPADDTAIVEAMVSICDEFEFYGYRRVGAALRQQGVVVNHKKIRRLMRDHDLQPKLTRRFVATTDSNHDSPRSLLRDMHQDSSTSLTMVASCLSENGLGRKPKCASAGRFLAKASSA